LGTEVLGPEELVTRFGSNPLPIYAYNAAMAGVSVLLSQPVAGQWTMVAAWRKGDLRPVFILQTVSSLGTTILIVWFLISRGEGGRRRWREPLPLVFIVLLIANAAIGFAYAKDEIISIAGVFYALVAYAAVREQLVRASTFRHAIPLAIAILVLSSAWAMRTAGLHYRLSHAAFDARGQWAAVLRPGRSAEGPQNPRLRQIVARLKEEAIFRQGVAPHSLARWYQEWWEQN
jgi:hypothetical protein